MSYNITGIANQTTDLLTFTQLVNNELMYGYLGVLILGGVSIIAFLGFISKTQSTGKSLAATSFIMFTLSVLLRALSLISNQFMFISLISAAVLLAISWGSE